MAIQKQQKQKKALALCQCFFKNRLMVLGVVVFFFYLPRLLGSSSIVDSAFAFHH
jgi:hypothetical protein